MQNTSKEKTIYQLFFKCPNGTEYLIFEDKSLSRFQTRKNKTYNHSLTGIHENYVVRQKTIAKD